jgi:hypothetical protein
VAQALADVATIGILQERSIRETGVVAAQLPRAPEGRTLKVSTATDDSSPIGRNL